MKRTFLSRFCALVLIAALALMYAPGISEVVSVSVFAENGVTCGDLTVIGENYSYNTENDVLTILGGDATIVGNGSVTTTAIVVASGVNANITLDNVNITADVAFKIEDNSTGNVTVTLMGNNTLTSTVGAGLQKNGGEYSGTLTINGDGKLDAHCSGGAAIGGSRGNDGCNIVINGGEISGGDIYSAGIGGGDGGNGIVTVNGGTIDVSSNYGAGIGGGDGGNGIVTINGGTVTASSNYGAAIGGGDGGNGTVIVNGGTVNAYASAYGAAIGGGMYGDGAVAVNDGTVTAETYAHGAGIGGGMYGDGLVIITGGDITASGGGGDVGGGNGNTGNRTIVVTAEGVTVSTPTTGMVGVINSNGGITVTGYNGGNGVVTIPDSVLGYKITAVNDGIFDSVSDLTVYCESGSVAENYVNTKNISHVTYTSSGTGEITIIEYSGSDTEIALPETIDGMPLTAIGAGAFADNKNLTSVILPDSVTTVSASAFAGCENLTVYCSDENAAAACANSGVNCMVFANGWDMKYEENPELFDIIMSNPGPVCVITGFYGTGDVTVPASINGAAAAIIDQNAFAGNDGITSVTIPASVKKIVDGAFAGCDDLTIYCEEGSAGADYAAGNNFTYMTYTVTGSGVTVTGYSGSGEVTIPAAIGGLPVTSIGEDAFKDSDITSVTIPDSVTSIGDGAFSGCDNLKKVTCPESLEDDVKNSGISGDVEVTTSGTSDTPAKPDDPTDEHVHSFGVEWKYNDTSHWHECSCGAKSDTAAHVKDEGVTSDDKITYTCSICGYSWTEKIPAAEHVHSFGTEWKFDGTNHWHECECGERSDVLAHISDGGVVTTPATSTTAGVMTYTCIVCGYNWTSEIAPTGTYSPSGSTGTTSGGGNTSNVITVTGLSGARAYGYNGTVEVKISDMESAEDAGKKAMEQLGGQYFYYAFDISLFDKNGNPLTLGNGESITLEIPVPENMQASQNIVMYHIPDGNPEKIASTTFNKGGKKFVRFNANKFSPYMMVATDIEDVSSGSGADGNAEPIEPVSQRWNLPDAILPENKKLQKKRRRYRIISKR